MDLQKLDITSTAEEGRWMQVRHFATGEDIPGMRVRLAGKDSPQYRKAAHSQANHRAQTGQPSSEAIENAGIKIIVACTLEWEGFEEGGKVLPCTPTVVEQVYKKYLWLQEQVDKFIDTRSNYYTEVTTTEGKSLSGSSGASA